MSGADPMAAIASLVSDFWVRDLQKELIAVLKGCLLYTSKVVYHREMMGEYLV